MTKSVNTKMDKLAELIEYHNHQYFVNKESEIEDSVFDQLVRQLTFLENKYPQYKKSNSPTDKVGETIENNTFETVKHKKRMPSLGKSSNVDELSDFATKLLKKGVEEFVLEPKIDGLALELRYENGMFLQGITRGDGEFGDDITQTALAIKDIPKILSEPFTGEIRGEAYMKKSDFLAYNKTRELMGLSKYKNTRNLASGILKRKEVTEENNLISFLAYGIVDEDNEVDLYSEGISKLDEFGFNTSLFVVSKTNQQAPIYKFDSVNSNQELECLLNQLVDIWTQLRPTLDFDIDGLVLKANKISDQEDLGETQHSPNWATAFKFPAEEAITTLLDVVWTMGNKGNITPNARIEPVNLVGVTISNVTLHNLDELKRLDIKIGDQIVVSRRGDVIPKIESALKELRTGEETPLLIPTNCPADGVPTIADGAFLRCSNGDDCEYMKFAKIQNFVHSMEIEELGPSIIEKMLEAGIVKDLADLYDVKADQIEMLERMGKRSAAKIVKNVQASKEQALFRVIAGLTIKNVSSSTSKELINHYKSLEALLSCEVEELLSLPDIGPKTATNLYEWCQKDKNKDLLYKLIDRNVGKYEEQKLASSLLDNKSFCFTGSMVSYKRKELEDMVVDNGGTIGGVNKKLTYLVAGDKSGSKLDKANTLGIPVITESEFLEMLK